MPPPDAKERQYAEAMRKRAQQLEPQIAAALDGIPGGWAVLAMLMRTGAFRATRQQDMHRARKAAEGPLLEELLRCLARPSWKSIVELERHCGRQYGILDPFYDGPSGMADRIAAALGIELDQPPKPPQEKTP